MDKSNFNEFKKYHKNKYNRIIHIISFLVGFVAFCFLFDNNLIKYTIIFLYITSIFFIYYDIILISKILIIILIIFLSFKYLKIKSKLTLFIIIVITYILPELSHMYFKEKTYLYERLNKEQNIFMATIELIKHCINLVPYLFLYNKT